MTPRFSFVVAGRNDDYGGNLLHRMQVSLSCLGFLVERHSLDAELIVVEWNPPETASSLRESLTWPPFPRGVRIVHVPPEIHQSLPNADRMPIFEYAAKNVGIRRARGEFVLATNPDIVFSAPLIRRLTGDPLSSSCFYRADRRDVEALLPHEPIDEVLRLCQRRTVGIHLRGGSLEVRDMSSSAVRRRLLTHRVHRARRRQRRLEDAFHTNASGDFLLMARERWHELRGYAEFPTASHIDSYMVIQAAASGLRQMLLKPNQCIYHQEHERAVDFKHVERAGRPVTSYEQWVKDAKAMLRGERSPVLNDERWGLGEHDLKEEIAQGDEGAGPDSRLP